MPGLWSSPKMLFCIHLCACADLFFYSEWTSQWSPHTKYKQRAAPCCQHLVNRVWLETAGVPLWAFGCKEPWMVGYSKSCDLFIQVYKDTDTATDPVITSFPSLPIKTHLFDVPISLEFNVPNVVCTCLCVCAYENIEDVSISKCIAW